MKALSLMSVLVDDQDRALSFYRDKLGFVVAEDVPFGKERWLTVRAPGDQTVALSLNLAQSEEDRKVIGKQAGSKPLFALATDDCLGDYRRMKSAGVNFLSEPKVESYGTGVTLQDLYGNKIYLNQEPA